MGIAKSYTPTTLQVIVVHLLIGKEQTGGSVHNLFYVAGILHCSDIVA